MSGTSNPARLFPVSLGSITVDTAGDNLVSPDVLGCCFKPLRIVYEVTTALTVAGSVCTLTWRPNVGSASGAVQIAVWTQPVGADNTWGYIDLNKNNDTSGTVIGAGGPQSQYGIGGSKRFVGEPEIIVGPAGQFNLASDGASTGGVCNFWLVGELLSLGNEVNNATAVVITPTTVGAA